MKKLLYSTLFLILTSLAFTSCTEEEVTPSNDALYTNTSGGSAHPDKGN